MAFIVGVQSRWLILLKQQSSRVASCECDCEVGGDFHLQPATFDNPDIYSTVDCLVGPESRLETGFLTAIGMRIQY